MTVWDKITGLFNPKQAQADPGRGPRWGAYDYLWAWETSSVFNTGLGADMAVSQYSETLKQRYHLYRNTRLVWNPFPIITDFWGSVIYPGVLTRDGLPLPDGSPSAIPFPEDTKKEVIAAAVQIWSWSNMQALKYVIPHWAAIAGNVLIEVKDDTAAQKITLVPHWPGNVKEIELSPAGDVIRYYLEWQFTGADNQEHTYGQEVTKKFYRTYRDNAPYDYSDTGQGAEWTNDFGFVPACWVPHRPSGGTFANPAIGSALPELLQINSLGSMIDDGVARGMKPIPWFATGGNIAPLFNNAKRGSTDDFDPEDVDRESFTAFKLPEGTQVGKLDPSANVGDANARYERDQTEWLRKFPEVNMWESLRQRDVSGVAAEILHGDTRNHVLTVRPSTDRQFEKATQIAITMAAIRSRGSLWTKKTKSRAVFASFDATSWENEQLNFEIGHRPLIPAAPLTETEKAELADIQLNKLGLPEEYVFDKLGVPKDVIDKAAELSNRLEVATLNAQSLAIRSQVEQQVGVPQNGAQQQPPAVVAGQQNGRQG